MEIVTGYFISKAPALEAARYLRKQGIKGEITVIGRENLEDFREKSDRGDIDDLVDFPNYGVIGNSTGIPGGLNAFNFAGSTPFVTPLPVFGVPERDYDDFDEELSDWGLPKDIEREIKKSIDGGSSVVLVECTQNEKQFVAENLKNQGAQNIHI